MPTWSVTTTIDCRHSHEDYMRAIVQMETRRRRKASDVEFTRADRIVIDEKYPGCRVFTTVIKPETEYRQAMSKNWRDLAPHLVFEKPKLSGWKKRMIAKHITEGFQDDGRLEAGIKLAKLAFSDRYLEVESRLQDRLPSVAILEDNDGIDVDAFFEALSDEFRAPKTARLATTSSLLACLIKHVPKLKVLEDAVQRQCVKHSETLVAVAETVLEMIFTTLFVRLRFPKLAYLVVPSMNGAAEHETWLDRYFTGLEDDQGDKDNSVIITTRVNLLNGLRSLYQYCHAMVILSFPSDHTTLTSMIFRLYNGATPYVVDVYLAVSKYTWDEKHVCRFFQKYKATSKDSMVVTHNGYTFYNVTTEKLATLTGFRVGGGKCLDRDFVAEPNLADLGIDREGRILTKQQRDDNRARVRLFGKDHHLVPYDCELELGDLEALTDLLLTWDPRRPVAAWLRRTTAALEAKQASAQEAEERAALFAEITTLGLSSSKYGEQEDADS